MAKQTFILTLVAPPAFDCYFPRVEAERMANIIRDAIQHKSCSFIGPVPFTIVVERTDDAAEVAGEMPEYVEDKLDAEPQLGELNTIPLLGIPGYRP
jgi:hypothetical protein